MRHIPHSASQGKEDSPRLGSEQSGWEVQNYAASATCRNKAQLFCKRESPVLKHFWKLFGPYCSLSYIFQNGENHVASIYKLVWFQKSTTWVRKRNSVCRRVVFDPKAVWLPESRWELRNLSGCSAFRHRFRWWGTLFVYGKCSTANAAESNNC